MWLLRLNDYRSDETIPMEQIMTARDGIVSLAGTILFSFFYLSNAIPVVIQLIASKNNENDHDNE